MSDDSNVDDEVAMNLGDLVSPLNEYSMDVEGGIEQADEDDEEFGPDVSRDRWTERADAEEEHMSEDEELF